MIYVDFLLHVVTTPQACLCECFSIKLKKQEWDLLDCVESKSYFLCKGIAWEGPTPSTQTMSVFTPEEDWRDLAPEIAVVCKLLWVTAPVMSLYAASWFFGSVPQHFA